MTVQHHDLQRLLTAPILPTLLRLAAPNVMAMVMTVLVGIAETYYVGRLGTTPLAAMALVFPFAMLTHMMSAGAMGGGVSAAISRALGASDLPRAHTLLLHALVIGLGAGVLYSAIFLIWGPFFYALLGGQGQVLSEAVRYGQVLFAGALLVWLINTLASIVRATGNMRAPSVALVATAVLQIALGGVLALGAGPVPSMGMVGVALGHIIATAAGLVYFLWYLVSGQGRLTLKLERFQLQGRMFGDILRVGAVACLSPVQSVLAILIFTGLLAQMGTDAWARLFTQDEAVLIYARQYLVTTGPAFAFFGLGLTLYFASQGAGQVIGPVLAGTIRLILVAGAGYGLAQRQATSGHFYVLVAVAMVIYGVVTTAAVKLTPWGPSR